MSSHNMSHLLRPVRPLTATRHQEAGTTPRTAIRAQEYTEPWLRIYCSVSTPTAKTHEHPQPLFGRGVTMLEDWLNNALNQRKDRRPAQAARHDGAQSMKHPNAPSSPSRVRLRAQAERASNLTVYQPGASGSEARFLDSRGRGRGRTARREVPWRCKRRAANQGPILHYLGRGAQTSPHSRGLAWHNVTIPCPKNSTPRPASKATQHHRARKSAKRMVNRVGLEPTPLS
jgi:hypothetical protein